MRVQIRQTSMPRASAHKRLAQLDGDVPYEDFFNYVADLAALVAVYEAEVMVRTREKTKRLLRDALWSATDPMKLGYYFNNLIRVARLPKEQRPQLASGTASNEALTCELAARFKHVPGLYQATLLITCEAFQFLKLFSHNCAEYMPTDCQASQQLYVNHYVSAFAFSEEEWLKVLRSPYTFVHPAMPAFRQSACGSWAGTEARACKAAHIQ